MHRRGTVWSFGVWRCYVIGALYLMLQGSHPDSKTLDAAFVLLTGSQLAFAVMLSLNLLFKMSNRQVPE